MDEHPPSEPPQLPPPFDWSRYSGVTDPQMATAASGTPPAAPPVTRQQRRSSGSTSSASAAGRRRRRHPAHRTRVAAAIVSGATFVGLVGCTALGAAGDNSIGTNTAAPAPTVAGLAGRVWTDNPLRTKSPLGDRFGDDGERDDHGDDGDDHDDDRYDQGATPAPRYSQPQYSEPQYSQPQYSRPGWGGSAVPGSGSGSGPSTRSQAS